MICDIIKDLMPLYVADECSAASKEAVDAHVWSCDACRASLDAMQAPVALTPAVVDEQDTPKLEAMNFKKGFKKIRRRWLVSILCVILAIPFAFLGVNEVRGQGYAYSNLYAAYQTDAFMRKIIAKDYEGAAGMLDLSGWYEAVLYSESDRDLVVESFRKVEMGGDILYTRLPLNSDKQSCALENGDPAEFWAQIIIENALEDDFQNPIPTAIMEDAAQVVSEKTGEEVRIITPDSEEADDEYTYIEDMAPDGKAYFFPTRITREADIRRWITADYYTEGMFHKHIDMTFPVLVGTEYFEHTYEKLGYEGYRQSFIEKYVERFKKLDEQGVFATGYSITRLYRSSGMYEDENGIGQLETIWEIDYEITSSYSGERSNSYLTICSREDGLVFTAIGMIGNSSSSPDQEKKDMHLLETIVGEYYLDDDGYLVY